MNWAGCHPVVSWFDINKTISFICVHWKKKTNQIKSPCITTCILIWNSYIFKLKSSSLYMHQSVGNKRGRKKNRCGKILSLAFIFPFYRDTHNNFSELSHVQGTVERARTWNERTEWAREEEDERKKKRKGSAAGNE